MRLSTLRVLATSLFAGYALATSAPTCVSSSEGYQVGQVDYLFNAFCSQLSSNNFATEQQIYGLPVISFGFQSGSGSDTCDLNNCLASYQKLVLSCALPNSTVWGTGSLDAGCGTYNFTIWNTALNPITLGTPTTTLEGSTMTTAPLITLTSTTKSSATYSFSSVPTSTSASLTPSAIPSQQVFYEYSNSTSSASASGAATGTGSVVSTSVSASKTTAPTTMSPTKPIVGSTALGNGADVLRAGGFSLIAVACVFGWWL